MSYGYYGAITIDNTKVSGSSNLSNFTILISGTYDGTGSEPDIRTAANGGNVENTASGGASGSYTVPADLVFSPNTDGSSPYDFEIQEYDASTGKIIAWVEIPTLSYSSDTTLYMVYGDSGVTTSQEDVNGTWGQYGQVHHLVGSYNSTASEVKDSAGSNHGKAFSSRAPVRTTGKVGYGQDFQKGDVLDMGDPTTVDGATRLVIEFWYNPDTLNTNDVIIRKLTAGPNGFSVQLYSTNDDLSLFVINSAQKAEYVSTVFTTGGGWYHCTAVWDTSDNEMYFYINGATPSPSTDTGDPASIASTGDTLTIGGWTNDGGSFNYFTDGQLDEVRISADTSEVVTQGWAYTNYATQNSPATFYTMGAETSGGATTTLQDVIMCGIIPFSR